MMPTECGTAWHSEDGVWHRWLLLSFRVWSGGGVYSWPWQSGGATRVSMKVSVAININMDNAEPSSTVLTLHAPG